MRPNTPHIVFTLEHTICTGGHFYATSTLQDTLYGLEHNFFLGHLVTNTDHIASRLLLRRFAHFFHKRLIGPNTFMSRKVPNLLCIAISYCHREIQFSSTRPWTIWRCSWPFCTVYPCGADECSSSWNLSGEWVVSPRARWMCCGSGEMQGYPALVLWTLWTLWCQE